MHHMHITTEAMTVPHYNIPHSTKLLINSVKNLIML